MKKIIGLLVAWAAEDFIKPALEQAVEYCDEVFICVAPHSEEMKPFRDSTWSIANKFTRAYDKVKIINWSQTGFHATTKASILNVMLSKSKFRQEGNWIWILDVDEFYPQKTFNHIQNFINKKEAEKYDLIEFKEFYFYINTKHFLEGSHLRMFKIKHPNNIFQPTQRWIYAENPIVLSFTYCPMYHYGMLTNPHAKSAFWQSEYPGKTQDNKSLWLEKIYRNYDLKKQDYWIEKNFELFGLYSPWFSESFRPNPLGHLYEYDKKIFGSHPKFISKEMQDVEDFRVKYKFLPTSK